MKYIHKIIGDVKNFSGELHLAPLTALAGDNETMKSSVLTALQLALTGGYNGYANPRLKELVPRDSTKLYARAESMDATAEFLAPMSSRGTLKVPDTPGYTGALSGLTPDQRYHLVPTVAWRRLLYLTPGPARSALCARFGGRGTRTQLEAPLGLSEDQGKRWKTAYAELSAELSDPFDVAAAMKSRFDSQKRTANNQIKGLKTRVETLRREIQSATFGTETLANLEERRAKAMANNELQSITVMEATAKLAQLRAEIPDCNARTKELRSDEAELPEILSSISGREAQLNGRLRVANDALQAAGAEYEVTNQLLQAQYKSVDCCALCGGQAEGLVATLTERKVEAEREVARLARIVEELEQYYRDDVEQRRRSAEDLQRTIDSHNAYRERLTADVLAAEELLAQAEGAPTAPVESVEELDAAIAELRNSAHKQSILRDLSGQMDQLLYDATTAKILEDETKLVLKQYAEALVENATAAVNRHMPAGMKALLRIAGDKVEWCAIGVDGREHSTVSMTGAQRVALMIALALAWSEDAPARILILDDEDLYGFSPTRLHKLLEMLKSFVHEGRLTQVVLATTRPNEIPESWTVIHVSSS